MGHPVHSSNQIDTHLEQYAVHGALIDLSEKVEEPLDGAFFLWKLLLEERLVIGLAGDDGVLAVLVPKADGTDVVLLVHPRELDLSVCQLEGEDLFR